MYRQNSFSAKKAEMSFATQESNLDDTEGTEGNTIYLKTTGKFLNKNSKARPGGLIATFKNYSTRNKVWNINTICFSPKSGGFAIADERGQVYKMSVSNNAYDSVRLASTGVSAMCFINQHKHHLIIAYDSGSIVVVDSHTKDIIGNLQVKNKSIARIIKSNPGKLQVAIASDDKTLSIWDLK
jgi:WD40 repeat protein